MIVQEKVILIFLCGIFNIFLKEVTIWIQSLKTCWPKTSKKMYNFSKIRLVSFYWFFLWNHVNWKSAELRKCWGSTPHSVTLLELFFLTYFAPFGRVPSLEGGGWLQEGQTNYGKFRNFFNWLDPYVGWRHIFVDNWFGIWCLAWLFVPKHGRGL